MPPAQEQGLQWDKVTWYSKTLAVLLFVILVCGAFAFGVWYQKQFTPSTTGAQTSVPTQITSDSGTSYPAGFPQALASISTDGWKTYQSKNGWQIQYPSTWSMADCLGGGQVQFASDSNNVTCDAPTAANFFIAGPMSQNEATYNANKARIAQSLNLNGTPATRYIDALSGQSGSDFSEIIVVERNSQYFTLNFQKYLEYDLTAEKMIGTFKFNQ
jgi:hypothetical protein